LSQGGNCWEIASTSNCDLKSQLGFLIEEGNINLVSFVWKEDYFSMWKESLFLIKEVIYF